MGANDDKNKGGLGARLQLFYYTTVYGNIQFELQGALSWKLWSSKNVGLRILVRLQVLGPSGFMTQVSIKLLVYHHKA